MAGRRCGRAGCRAWARRGADLCAPHGRQAADQVGAGAAPMVGGAVQERGQWTARELLALERLATELLAGDDAGLATEIAAARLALLRVLRDEDDAVRLADGVAKAAAVVFKALQLERRDGDEAMAPLATASTRILTELGLGADDQGAGV